MEPTLRLEHFQGPFSLLYHLIERNKIDLYDIPIAQVTDQYLAVLAEAKERKLEIMSEFLVMAATLLEMKSRMLLPKTKQTEEAEEEVDPREALVAKLLEYKKYQQAAKALKEREEQGAHQVFKAADASLAQWKKPLEPSLEAFLGDVTLDDLYQAFQEVMARRYKKIDRVRSSFRRVERDLFTVEEKMGYIKDLLLLTPRVSFWEVFRPEAGREEVVVTFLALLELMKLCQVRVAQEKTFGEIVIMKGEKADETK